MKSRPINLAEALRDPGAAFTTPEEVVSRPELSRKQKIEILTLWEYDAAEAEVATEEGMPGGNSDLLRRILLALDGLITDAGIGDSAPTKQRALLRHRAGRN